MAEQAPHGQPYYEDDEITLKELFQKIGEFWTEIWKNKFLVILITIPFIAFFAYKAVTTKPTYKAKYTFMLNEDSGSPLGGLSSALSSFGLGGGGGGGKYNPVKMLELAKSRLIVSQVLFSKTEIDGKEDLLANHLIEKYNFDEEVWSKDTTGLIGFKFNNANPKDFSTLENKALLNCYKFVVGSENTDPIFSSGFDEETGIIELNYTTEFEDISIETAKIHFDSLSAFYVDQAIEQPELTYTQIKVKQDSVFDLLQSKEIQLAVVKDRSKGLYSAKEKLKEFRIQRDLEALYKIYAEIVKNVETSKFMLDTQRPVIREIDQPIAPLEPEESSLLKSLLIGGFLGGFLAVLFIIGRKIFRDTMAE